MKYNHPMKIVHLFLTLILLAVATPLFAAPTAAPILSALDTFTSHLNDEQRGQLQFAFEDKAREGWNFLPKPHVGLSMHGFNEEQSKALMTLLQTCLSESGLEKAEAIRYREIILGGDYDENAYFLSVFGDPKGDAPWMLRWEGHHLSLNWTIAKGEVVSSSPQFMGANPTNILEGEHKGERTLKVEELLGRDLVKSLTAEQVKKAVISDTAPADILTRLQQTAERQTEEGILYSELDSDQQKLLRTLVKEYAQVHNPTLAKARMAKVKKDGWDTIRFAWMGGLEAGQGHYYRIQGPEFLIEYDNTQNNANHVHCAWRDFKGDFGRDVLQLHYKQAHNTANPMLNWVGSQNHE